MSLKHAYVYLIVIIWIIQYQRVWFYLQAGQLLENYLKKMKVLVLSNPHWGIVVFDARTGITGEDSSHHSDLIHHGSLTVSDPALPLMCYLKLKLFGLFPALLITVGGKLCECTSLNDNRNSCPWLWGLVWNRNLIQLYNTTYFSN